MPSIRNIKEEDIGLLEYLYILPQTHATNSGVTPFSSYPFQATLKGHTQRKSIRDGQVQYGRVRVTTTKAKRVLGAEATQIW
jgi:hypothetical protein